MGQRRIVNWEEQDIHTRWRRLLCWTSRAGTIKAAKRRTHRRERREAALEIAVQWDER